MLKRLSLLLRAESGSAQVASLAAIVALVALMATTALFQSSASASYGSGDSAARNLAAKAASVASGAASHTSRLALHKASALPIQRSSSRAWLSGASGAGSAFSVTATAEPSGNTFTVSRSANGSVSHTCTVAARGGSDACRRVDARGHGSW